MKDLARTGFWPHTFVSGRSPELPVRYHYHYHDHDVIGYVIEGETYLLEEDETNVPIRVGAQGTVPVLPSM